MESFGNREYEDKHLTSRYSIATQSIFIFGGRIMEMKQYLIDTFTFNDLMNAKLLAKIKALPNQQQCIKFFSHLINSQKKWMVRIIQYPQDPKMDWWEPVYRLDELENEWRIEKSRKMREGERRERGDMPDPSSVHLRR
jgi:hypothetical protein